MKKFFNKKVLIGVCLVFSLGLIFFYEHFTSSPEYSLNKIKDAYNNHDLKEFNKYVDTKSVITNLLSKFPEDDESLLGNIYKNLTQNQIIENWENYINNFVENGPPQLGTINKMALDSLKKIRCEFTGVKETNIQGKVATITLNLYQKRYDTTLTLDIKMRDMNGYWQLFDISDLQRYVELGVKLEKDHIEKLNNQSKKNFLKNIQISDLTIKSTKDYSWYQDDYKINVKNIGNKPIKSLQCEIIIYNKVKFERQRNLYNKSRKEGLSLYGLNNGEFTLEKFIELEEGDPNDLYDDCNIESIRISTSDIPTGQQFSVSETYYISHSKKNQSDYDIYIRDCEILFEGGKNNITWNRFSSYYLFLMYPFDIF